MALKAFELFSIRSKKTNSKKTAQPDEWNRMQNSRYYLSLCMWAEEEIERHRKNSFLFFLAIAVVE